MRVPLSGCRVWLTRPAHQAEGWAAALEAAGATVLREPLLTIEPPADIEAARAGLIAAEAADRILATSTNAVDAAWRLKPDFAPQGTLYGVGAASADAQAARAGRWRDRRARSPASGCSRSRASRHFTASTRRCCRARVAARRSRTRSPHAVPP